MGEGGSHADAVEEKGVEGAVLPLGLPASGVPAKDLKCEGLKNHVGWLGVLLSQRVHARQWKLKALDFGDMNQDFLILGFRAHWVPAHKRPGVQRKEGDETKGKRRTPEDLHRSHDG